MALRFKKTSIMLPLLLMAVLLIVFFGQSTRYGNKPPEGQQAQWGDMSDLGKKLSSLNSSCDYLTVDDLYKFRRGRAKDDILKAVQWRAGSVVAGDCNGRSIFAIDYTISADSYESHRCESFHAIFVNDKFEKFIRWLPSSKVVDKNEILSSRPKRTKVGDDCVWLTAAMDSEDVSIEDLKKEIELITPPPKHADYGLTAAFLLVRAVCAVRGLHGLEDTPASEKDYLRNAALRDQFNAARLNIGMTEAEVEAVLKAKPLESGKVEAGLCKIYGSNESFNISKISGPWFYFSNILVVFREGKSISICSISAEYDWRRDLGEVTDLLESSHP